MNPKLQFTITASSKAERFLQMTETIYAWIRQDAMKQLISLFGGDAKKLDSPLKESLPYLESFVKRWDFRAQKGGTERWAIVDNEFVKDHETEILLQMKSLGLIGRTKPALEPDFILPLGGARRANFNRIQMVKKILDKEEFTGKHIVALSGFRPLNGVELPFISEYAPNAGTEFDAINGAIEIVFGVREYDEQKSYRENENLCSAQRTYLTEYRNCQIVSLAAPSGEPGRRANSMDTFRQFLRQFPIKAGQKILLVTSCIYVPYQLCRFQELALEGDFTVDCIGVSDDLLQGSPRSGAASYLQETKATVDAISLLIQSYR